MGCVMCAVLNIHCWDRGEGSCVQVLGLLTMKSFPNLMAQKRKTDKYTRARPLSLGGNETEPGVTKDAEWFLGALPLWPVNSVGESLVMGYLISQTSSWFREWSFLLVNWLLGLSFDWAQVLEGRCGDLSITQIAILNDVLFFNFPADS